MPHHMTPQVIERYRAYLLENEKSPATIEKYLRDIRCLYSFLAQRGTRSQDLQGSKESKGNEKAPKAAMSGAVATDNPQTQPLFTAPLQAATPAKVTVDKPALLAWREQLGQTRAPGTVNGMLSAVNGLFKFLGWQDCQLRFLKVQRRLFRSQRRQLTQAEYRRLLAAAEQKGDRRLQLLLQTMCATGIRVSEVPFITLQAARQGSAQITLKGKIRTILLPGKLCRKLRQYAQAQKITGGPLFVTRNGTPLPRRQIWAR